MENFTWGIIGCGDVTEKKSGPAFNKVPHSALGAVMRRDVALAKDYAARHNVAKWYGEAQELINDPNINAIYVATPPSSHEEYAIASMDAGKPVYIEKPMSVSAGSAERIAARARQKDVKVCVAHYRRYLPYFVMIKELLDQKAIGDPKYVSLAYAHPYDAPGFAPGPSNWRLQPQVSGGGIFHDLAPHQLDLMLYLFGEPLEVKGTSFNQSGYYEADDIVSASVKFKHNVLFNGLWSFTAPESEKTDTCKIVGTKGSLSFSIFIMNSFDMNVHGKKQQFAFDTVEHVQQPMINEVVRYFRGERDNPCSAEEGVSVMRMIDEITKVNK